MKTGEDINLGILGQSLGYLLRRAQLTEFQRFAERFAAYDVRPVQFAILVLIASNPGINQSRLGRLLAVKRANMVGLLNELEQRHLLARVASPTDRRSHVLELTPAGVTLTATLQDLHAAHERELGAIMTEADRVLLLRLLKQFHATA